MSARKHLLQTKQSDGMGKSNSTGRKQHSKKQATQIQLNKAVVAEVGSMSRKGFILSKLVCLEKQPKQFLENEMSVC